MDKQAEVDTLNVAETYDSADFLESIPDEIKPMFEGITDLGTFLNTQGRLSLASEDEQLIIEQASLLLEMFYVHMPLKRAMHAIDPLQQLKLIKHKMCHIPEGQIINQNNFHAQMLEVFTSLRDRHTNYLLPAPFSDKIAFLPFLIEEYLESGNRKYIVSKLIPGFSHSTFEPGVEVLYWNGIPIERAVELNGDHQAGSNLEARHARGLDSMTIRPMIVSLPPDEHWVMVSYRSLNGQELEFRQNWLVTSTEPASDSVDLSSVSEKAMSSGIDIKTQMIQDLKKTLFASDVAIAEKKLAKGEISRAGTTESLETSMPGNLIAHAINTPYGTYGYIRIFTFDVEDDDAFIDEFIRLAELLPKDGLIIDVRDNGGGLISASERLLQVLTPNQIKPEPAQFINTPLALELCRRNQSVLSPWIKSMDQCVEIGSTFSQGIPLTSEKACNDIGQRYYGPVILITDALCYSATDIFAAGFQDNHVGLILGTNWNTGAGGANVWTHELLRLLMGEDSPLKPLTNGISMNLAIRRLLRVHENEGMPLEELGVVPDYKYDMTKDDLIKDNIDLKNYAASILAKMPVYGLSVNVSSRDNGKLIVNAKTKNISRLDLFMSDRPLQSLDIVSDMAQFVLERHQESVLIELRGYKNKDLVAVRRVEI